LVSLGERNGEMVEKHVHKKQNDTENKHFIIEKRIFLANCLVKSIISNNFAASK
jgi:hypothetical protein